MIVKKTIGRVAFVLAALGLVGAIGVWSLTCPTSECDRVAYEAQQRAPAPPEETEPTVATADDEANGEQIARPPAEVRRLGTKIRVGPLLEQPDPHSYVIEMEPVEPNDDEESSN